MSTPLEPRPRLTTVQWLICIIAAIGFAFDIYELLMLPLIIRPALLELGGIMPGSEEFRWWLGMMFYVPAFVGGIFGLFGGYLTDRLGRRRVLTGSILLYAFSAFAAGFSTSLEMLLFFRCTTFVGVCVEFVAAVAWLAELFPEPERREKVLGYTQAFSSIGGLMVAGAFKLCLQYADRLPAIVVPEFILDLGGTAPQPHAPWRYTLMSGLIPAIPLILIRPFLPESPEWQKRKDAGTLKRPSIGELFAPHLLRTTVVTTLMFACSYGAAFGAIQQMPQIIPGMPDVQAATEAAVEKLEQKPDETPEAFKKRVGAERNKVQGEFVAHYATTQEVGGLVGRFLLALLVIRILSRRRLIRLFLVPGLFLMPVIFGYLPMHNRVLADLGPVTVTTMGIGIFIAALLTVGQFSFWGNYLPHAYPIHLRGTGESFAANIGGRMIGTSMAYVTAQLADPKLMPGATPAHNFAYAAAIIGGAVYLVCLIASFWLPEPGQELEHGA